MTEGQPHPPQQAEFSLFCYSLATQAQVSMGVMPNPITNETETNLEQAKYFIDILEMLKEKSEGNRTEEEESVLMSLLFDIRMLYVKKSRGG